MAYVHGLLAYVQGLLAYAHGSAVDELGGGAQELDGAVREARRGAQMVDDVVSECHGQEQPSLSQSQQPQPKTAGGT